MEKNIWVLDTDRKAVQLAQRTINASRGMRAICMLSMKALQNILDAEKDADEHSNRRPSLILLDYEMARGTDFLPLRLFREGKLTGVPLFFMVSEPSREIEEDGYERGAIAVLPKSFSEAELQRIERTAWQYENTRNYERLLQKQATELQNAREVFRLNQQLESRNELLHQVFGRYFQDEVVDVILDRPEEVSLGGERRHVAVMLSDIRGFASISEEISAETLTELLNYFFGKMTQAISHYHGTVIEFLGDGILAVFGAPLPSAQQEANAIAAAISMQNAMQDVNAYCLSCGYPALEMGVGIHYGDAFIGNVGTENMMRFNVIGKVVNECSRIESLSVGGQVLASQAVVERAHCPVEVSERFSIQAKGVPVPLEICRVKGIGGEYGCQLAEGEPDLLFSVTEPFRFHLFPLEGKAVGDAYVPVHLRRLSLKRAEVLPLTEEAGPAALPVYANVVLSGYGQDGQECFSGVYAKVMPASEEGAVLHFTHTNQEFLQFAKGILRHSAKIA